MDEELISDLKQFIATTIHFEVSNETSELKTEFKIGLKKLEVKFSKQISELSAYVADTIDNSNNDIDKRLANHEVRIKKLERAQA